ncbi:hypothetical protein Csa_022442 [Cucumis sativus]|uniref:Uncharacterized protein n=1 Tax=Cucumis sativus TaxID=3659 RepID=A0A0A0LQM5_CUCSA|nr:hypothetical protein Csa_022442 [Cucumis sativus]
MLILIQRRPITTTNTVRIPPKREKIPRRFFPLLQVFHTADKVKYEKPHRFVPIGNSFFLISSPVSFLFVFPQCLLFFGDCSLILFHHLSSLAAEIWFRIFNRSRLVSSEYHRLFPNCFDLQPIIYLQFVWFLEKFAKINCNFVV